MGTNGKWSYRFEQVTTKGNKFNLTSYRLNQDSGWETRISKHCYKSITNAAAKANIKKFMKAVVEGL